MVEPLSLHPVVGPGKQTADAGFDFDGRVSIGQYFEDLSYISLTPDVRIQVHVTAAPANGDNGEGYPVSSQPGFLVYTRNFR